MRRTAWTLFLVIAPLLLLPAGPVRSAALRDGYPTPSDIEQRIRQAARDIPGATLVEYGTTLGGRPLLMLQIARGSGKTEDRPGFLVVAGIEPSRLHAAEIALEIARSAAGGPGGGRDPLERVVLYVIADANPDGRARVLSGAADDRNANPVDDDRDGLVDEDPPNDLDGDGSVRWLRVHRPGGLYRPDSTDARAGVRADAAKGEAGVFDVLPEGRDDDRDGAIDEDGPGGINLNVNFPHDFRMFSPEVGPYAVSEKESKALVDLVLAHPNIGTALVFGTDDVLTRAPKADSTDKESEAPMAAPVLAATTVDPQVQRVLADRSPVKGILKSDLAPYERAAARYAARVGIARDRRATPPRGSLADWLRYQEGVFALSTPGWSLSAPRDTSAAAGDSTKTGSGRGRPGGPARSEMADDVRALKALEKNGIAAFTPWKEISHPDFPNRRVEAGGLDPLVFRTPPHADVDSLASRHAAFVRELLAWAPELLLEEPVVETMSPGVYRVRAEIANTGYLPTALYQGVRSRKARPVRIDLTLPEGGRLLAGQKVTLIHTLAGNGGHRELEWILKAPPGSRLALLAGTPRAGQIRREVRLP
jgi:hypothetical protein